MTSSLIYPMAAHVALAALLYAALTVARAPVVWGVGAGSQKAEALAAREARISANLSNQFEWPVFFHVGCVLAIQLGAVTAPCIVLAWLFVAGRVLHSTVQVFTTNVRLRGLVFTINFLAVLALWSVLLLSANGGHGT